jgi:hypothetical protein
VLSLSKHERHTEYDFLRDHHKCDLDFLEDDKNHQMGEEGLERKGLSIVSKMGRISFLISINNKLRQT